MGKQPELQAGNPDFVNLMRQKQQEFYNAKERLPNTEERKALAVQAWKELRLQP